MVNAERMGSGAGWTTNGRSRGWIRSVGGAAEALAAIAGISALYLAWTIIGSPARAIEYTMFGLAGLSGVAAFAARWAQGALTDRLDLLSQALDAAPDAQMIVAGDGRIAYANLAFDQLFPGKDERPLDRIERSLAADPQSVTAFRQLRSRVAAGVRATVAVSLQDARGDITGRFTISASPIIGRLGYSFLNIHDITARNELEAVIRDERNKLVDFFDNAPIGFYSVDGNGRLRFVNQTLAQWLGTTPAKLLASGGSARFHSLVAGRRDATLRSLWLSGRWDAARRSIAQNLPRPHHPSLDRAERCRIGRRIAHTLCGVST